jgi:hypothetical protein
LAPEFASGSSIPKCKPESLETVLHSHYGPRERRGWGPRLRSKFSYYTPDDWYEAFILEQVTDQTDWLDVGCGSSILPYNPALAKILSQRCHLLFGTDPSDNIGHNSFIHEGARCAIEDLKTAHKFDLITLRMVAEHISHPKTAVAALSCVAKPGCLIVVYTVWKWAPVSLVAGMTSMPFHHFVKRILWRTEERDTFPVQYRMNTRAALRQLFAEEGFIEETFHYLGDCRSSLRSQLVNAIELSVWWILRALRIDYPERCILASYRKISQTSSEATAGNV